MKRKILFTDLDGTLLNSEKNISPEDLEAIKQLTISGHKFVISTGRPLQSAVLISERYGWNDDGYYISSYNGGLIYDCGNKQTIIRRPIPIPYVRHILDEAYKAGLHAHTYDDVNVVSERDTKEFRDYTKGIMVPGVVVEDVVTYLKQEPIKVIVISQKSRKLLEEFRAYMTPWCKDKLTTVFSSPILLEFENPLSTKGFAVRYMCEHFNIPISDSIAVGDEENDISMIEAAGLGIAMSNATANTKAAADHITVNDNNHSGICEIINRFVL
ncbi:MAG: Cof-type HAD-IIB family hydrolase [Lachnospiraceae bacterium]|nr:Cof-type HAD-IIB family hydrolase [Lachnospiraceae bacterium]